MYKFDSMIRAWPLAAKDATISAKGVTMSAKDATMSAKDATMSAKDASKTRPCAPMSATRP